MKIPPLRLLAPALFLFSTLGVSAITVTLDDNYPPYSFRNADGHLQGILVDTWDLWSRRTGESVTLVPLPWSEALATMAEGRADVLDTVFLTPARAELYDFTASYASVATAVFHRDGLTGITGIKDLKGYQIGIKARDAAADVLKAAGVTGFREFPSYEALIDAAGRGEVHVFCMDVPPALHFLYAKGLSAHFRQGFVVAADAFRRAVPKGKAPLFNLVARGFSLISADETQAIERRWKGTPLPDSETSRMVLATIGGALAVILLLVALVASLRWQVRRRTGELAGAAERLKVSEARARAVVAALPDLLFVLDEAGVVLECRAPDGSDLYQDTQRFLGHRLLEFLPPELAREARDQLAALSRTGGMAVLERELPIRDRNRTFDARIVRMDDGRFLAIVRDVSATRLAWKDDLRRNKLESLGVLAGGLAHDFNNSLAVIQGFVSLARVQLATPEKALASLDKAIQASRRAAGLTSQLRVLANGSDVQRRVLSVRDLAEEAAALALVGSPCTLAVEASGGPWAVEADPEQLSQAFHNLVLNAVQAMPKGGAVTLVFRRLPEEKIVVSVVDEGSGIPSDSLPLVFDPYFTTKPKASGLGLSVVHAVVQHHGGTVTVDSRPGRGTAFTVTLPASSAPLTADPSDTEVALPGEPGQLVLIMEDEGEIRDLMVQIVTALGLEPTACRNGREALEAFDVAEAAGRPFVLVVSDLLVPGEMGGRDMIAQLRTRKSPFRALAVTGFSTERSAEDFHHQGFDVIVGKPFTVDELKSRIAELMKSPWKTASNV